MLHAPGLTLDLDADGALVAIAAAERPDVRWLVGPAVLEVVTSDGPLPLGPAVVTVDADEVEVERLGAGLRTLVRHSVDAAWDVRVVLANESGADPVPTDLDLTDVRLAWRPDPACVVVALAAGSTAAYAVQPADGRGPVLHGRLRSGSQPGIDADALVLGPVRLGPGHRWAATWRFEVAPDVRSVPAGALPATTWLEADQTVLLPAGPDVAVVAPGLVVEVGPATVEVGAVEPGTSAVELRGARGTSTYALTWAPDLDGLVDAVVERLVDGPRTPGGTVRLPDAAAGLLVQDALVRRTGGPPDDLADALELLVGELVELDPGARDGDHLVLALLEPGRTAARFAHDLVGLGAGPLGNLAGLLQLGAGLGAGLPGRVVPAPPVEQVAHAAALLGMLDEPTGQRLGQAWGTGAAEVARQAAAQVRARCAEVEDASARRALAWLVLGRPPR